MMLSEIKCSSIREVREQQKLRFEKSKANWNKMNEDEKMLSNKKEMT